MFIPDPVSDFFPSRIPDPNCLHPGSRIRIKEFKYFNPKKNKKKFLSSRKYDPGCSSRIPDPDAEFLPIPDPGSRGQKGTGSRIRIRNTGKNLCIYEVISGNYGQRYILRDRRPSKTTCPARFAGQWERRNWNSVLRRGKYYVLGRLEQPRQEKSLLYRHDKPNKSTKEGSLSFVLFESPFTSVSTASRGHPSLVSLIMGLVEPPPPFYVVFLAWGGQAFVSVLSMYLPEILLCGTPLKKAWWFYLLFPLFHGAI